MQLAALALSVQVAACDQHAMPADGYGLDCIFDFRAPATECDHVADRQLVQKQPLSDARELILRSVAATRSGARLSLDIQLDGRFWSEIDQNLYVFIGAAARAGATTTYALTSDPQFFTDVGYPVRGSVSFPHANDIRVGVMAPSALGYTPQVYVRDPVRAEAVGPDAGIEQVVEGSSVRLEIPLDRFYGLKQAPIPERLSITVVTARDYVGFIDQRSALDLVDGSSAAAGERPAPPVLYPEIDQDSHVFKGIALKRAGDRLVVELTMAAPIKDWGQTNLHLFFVPTPPYPAASALPDPSKTMRVPYKWSYYCGVYSPRRIFCKASAGRDFTFDTAYAERGALAAPEGVELRDEGGGRYVLELPAGIERTLRAQRATFALIASAGRDGSRPTSWYGGGGTLGDAARH